MKFDPTINTGTIVQIGVLVASVLLIYTQMKTDQVQQRADLEAVKTATIVEREQTRESLLEIKANVRELQRSNNEIKESLAILRGRSATTSDGGGTSRK